MDSGKPFDALKSLMGTLPDGPENTPAGKEKAPRSAAAQTVTLYFERKGRGGK